MKKIYILPLLLCIAASAFAQSQSVPSLFAQNPLSLNPAYAGANNTLQLSVHGRNHYSGVAGNPQNLIFTASTPLTQNLSVGLRFNAEEMGIFSNTYGAGVAAYRVQIKDDVFVQFGMTAGMVTRRMDSSPSQLNAFVDLQDPTLNDFYNRTSFRVGSGIMLQAKNLEFGLAAPDLLEEGANLQRHLLFNLGYNFKMENISLKPYLVARALPDETGTVDLSLIAQWKDILWVQPAYRTNGSVLLGTGVNLKHLGVGYAYELPAETLSMATSGSHEIFLNITVGNLFTQKDKGSKAVLSTPVEKEDDSLSDEDRLLALLVKMEEKGLLFTDLVDLQMELNKIKAEANQIERVFLDKPGDYQLNRSEVLYTLPENILESEEISSINSKRTAEGYYVVIQTLTDRKFAQRLSSIYTNAGVANQLIFDPKKKKYFLYTERQPDLDNAILRMRKTRQDKPFDAWVMIVKDKR